MDRNTPYRDGELNPVPVALQPKFLAVICGR